MLYTKVVLLLRFEKRETFTFCRHYAVNAIIILSFVILAKDKFDNVVEALIEVLFNLCYNLLLGKQLQ